MKKFCCIKPAKCARILRDFLALRKKQVWCLFLQSQNYLQPQKENAVLMSIMQMA